MLNSDDFNKDKKLKYYSVNVSIIYFWNFSFQATRDLLSILASLIWLAIIKSTLFRNLTCFFSDDDGDDRDGNNNSHAECE